MMSPLSINSMKFIQSAKRCIQTSVRTYSKRKLQTKPKPIDPRKNVQYPYVPGDPIQEDAVRIMKKMGSASLIKPDPNTAFAKDKKREDKRAMEIAQKSVSFGSNELNFLKLKEGDIRLGRNILAAKSDHWKSADTILLEGKRLITDALVLGAKAKCIYFCDTKILEDIPPSLLQGVDLYQIMYRDMKTFSDSSTPSGIMGIFQKPMEGTAVAMPETTLPITVIFDSLKDPGNVGTLIRSAAAVGCERVIVTKGTVNVWDCKVLRSAMGGHFCIPIYSGLNWTDIPNYMDVNTQVLLANTQQSAVLSRSFDNRLRSEDLDPALYETGETSESKDENSQNPEDSDNSAEEEDLAEESAQVFKDAPMSICEYSNIKLNFPAATALSEQEDSLSIALVLGGETEGLSAQAKRFAYRYYGQYVSIPMSSNTNSLNTSIAGSIILYELRRQLLAARPGVYSNLENN